MKITVTQNNKIENFDLKEIALKCKDLSKIFQNKVIPSSIHHAKSINITVVVYIYNTHIFSFLFVNYIQ